VSLLRGGIHGSALSGEGGERCKIAMEYRVTDWVLGVLSSWRGWWAERFSHGDEEAGRDAGMCERAQVVGVVHRGIGDVRRG
jgi:hypothetical protein